MVIKYYQYFFMLVLFTGMNYLVEAQITPAAAVDSAKRLDILRADRENFQDRDSLGKFVSLAGHVRLKQGKTFFYCDSAVLNQRENIFEAFGNIHINDADSVQTYSQYLKYYGKDKKAILKRKVKLTDGKAVLTTDELEYNTLTKIGTYLKGGKVVNAKTVLTSTEGYYYGETRDVIFKRKVVLIDPQYRVTTDTLLYNTYTQIARFVAPTTIKSDKRTIKTSEGYYDLPAKKAVFGKRPRLQDVDYTLDADDLAFDDATHFGEAQGNVVYKSRDTANNYTIIANNLKTNNISKAILATQKPLMIIKQGRDTIYVAADTLFSGKLTEGRKSRSIPDIVDSATARKTSSRNKRDSSSNRFFEGYNHVRIFTDSLQAVGDSMFYSFEDSVFRLFKDPVVWAQGNQISGDTIYVYTLNKKPKRFYVFENALAISKVAKGLYNQVKGNTINALFNEGNVDSIRAKGNAESIYFVSDDQGVYMGANHATSDLIDMYFKQRKLHKIVPRSNLKGVITPIRQVMPEQLKLKGFQWLEDRRPKTKYELIGT
jgi:lipopolysaccharide export system protein LptA